MLDLDGLLRFAVEQGASDVHLKVGSRPCLRVDGRLREGPFDTVEPTDTERLATAVIPRAAGRGVRHRARVRLHVRDRRSRPLPGERVPPARLRGPRAPAGAARHPQLRGARPAADRRRPRARAARPRARDRPRRRGQDRDHRRHGRPREPAPRGPHRHHRGPGRGAPSPTSAPSSTSARWAPTRRRRCRASSTRSGRTPTCIVLGHLTDEAAASAVLQAAEIGHLVIAAMSTVTAVDSIDRFVELFPPHRQRQARSTLAATLRGVVSQRLLPACRWSWSGAGGRDPRGEHAGARTHRGEPARRARGRDDRRRALRHADLRPEPGAALPQRAGGTRRRGRALERTR